MNEEKEEIYFCELCGEEYPEGNAEWYGYECPKCGGILLRNEDSDD